MKITGNTILITSGGPIRANDRFETGGATNEQVFLPDFLPDFQTLSIGSALSR
jgi:hypothetical protein